MFERALETLDAAALREHQWRRVQALARALAGANPFWTGKWRAAGVRSSMRTTSTRTFERSPAAT